MVLTPQGMKCLHDAAREDSVDTARWMMEARPETAGAALQDQLGNTPLHIALNRSSYCPSIVSLLALEMVINLTNIEGLTPFHLVLKKAQALQDMYTVTVHNFLSLGADPHLRLPGGQTPLETYLDGCLLLKAPFEDSMFEVILWFLEGYIGLSPWLRGRERVLEWTLIWHNPYMPNYIASLAKILCETVDINHCNTKVFHPLHQAVRRLDDSRNLEECIDILLDRGTDPNRLDNNRLSPLQVLVQLRKGDSVLVRVTEKLLKYGANPMQGLDSPKWTILHASQNLSHNFASRSIIKLLLNASFECPDGTLPPAETWQSDWFESWTEACKSMSNWRDVRRCLREGPLGLEHHFPQLGAELSDVVVEVLAAKCVESAEVYLNTVEEKLLPQLVSRRNGVALALGDCRKLGIDIEDNWCRCLLMLTMRCAEYEVGF